jgi:hypothetical protein
MLINADLPYLPDTGTPVGSEQYSKEFGHDVVEILAVVRIHILLAVSTACEFILYTTRPHFAPGCLLVFMTTRAPAL